MKFKLPPLPKRPKPPPLVVKLVLLCIIGALFINCLTSFAEFPLNGNPFQWYKAQEFYKSATTNIKTSDFEGAARKLKEAVQIYDKSSRFYVALGDCDVRLRHYDEAKDAYQKAVTLNSSDVILWKKLSKAWALVGNQEQAMAAIRIALEKSPSDPGANAQLGLLLAANGQMEEAAKIFDQSRTLDRDTAEYWYLAGQYFKLLGKPQETEAAFRQAQGKDQTEPEYAEWLGMCLASLGKTSEAEKYLNKAVILNPGDAEYWGALAEAQDNQGHMVGAMKSIKKALDLDAMHHLSWQKIYGAMLHHEGKFSEAEKVFESALAQGEDSQAEKYYLNCLLAQNKFQKAMDFLHDRLNKDKTDSDYDDWICLGDIFVAANNADKAKDCYNKALSIKSIDQEARQAVRKRIDYLSAKP